ncbi:uncharacterized protein TNCT_208321 [Trichonephila clavata]|uniref:Uncharacterized protein n=1 Tax=Trichonephila clavata TaxID=2740835 RepID=A0A8X6KI82_TRICU|nr:uncharacterized protein TNCT_208321 [Trichonephila clavata]
MATAARLLLALLLLTVGISTWAIASESEENNKISGEDESVESRSDYPDIDDLSSFFDFDLGTSSESEKGYPNPPKTSRNKYYYYYKADGPRYYESDYPPKKQVVTPGSHYKPQDDTEVVSEMPSVNDSKSTISQAIVGPYQISVVDGNSPLLSKLGLKKEDLEKLSGHTKRSIINASLVGSDSIPTATYAENPRPDYPQSGYNTNHPSSGYSSNNPPSGYAPNHQPPSSPNSHSYEQPKYSQYGPDHTERQYRPSNDYYPVDTPQPHRSYGPGPAPAHPPPQGSYDPKSYIAVQNSAQQHQSSYSYGHPPPAQSTYNQYSSPAHNHYPSPPTSYAPKRNSGEPWRQSSPVHTDWDDKQSKKPETYHTQGPHAPHPPPTSYGNTPSNSVPHYPKPSYGSSAEKPGYRYATYSKPQTAPKPTYSATSSSSSEYSSHKPSYHPPSSGYSTSVKAPSRAGSVSYAAPSHNHYHESSKPGITISFKAKSPSHGGGGGGGGLKIPVSLNPLDVVKKLLPLSSLNPLNNKKVTIGITIENKKDSHHDHHEYHSY